MNRFKTFSLMLLLTIILVVLGGIIGGEEGLIGAFIFALLLNFFSYWFSAKLAVMMTRSRPLKEEEAPEVYRAVRELVTRSGMPMPALYLMPSMQPNAFASGRNPQNAIVSVTVGLLKLLDYEELKGVLAHELAHIRNHDILINTVVAVLAGALTFISRIGLWGGFGGSRRGGGRGGGPIALLFSIVGLLLLPFAAMLIRMAISRSQEFETDATGAAIAGHPHGLADALGKMQTFALPGRRQPINVSEATAHMFIMNPLSARGMSALFSTHPPLEERIRRLRAMEI